MVVKLLIIICFGGALANSVAAARTEPPLLIEDTSVSLDARG